MSVPISSPPTILFKPGTAGQHLYIIQSRTTGSVKVGRSGNPDKRLNQLQTGCPYILKLILIAPDLGDEEFRVHQNMYKYRTRHITGEWFHEQGLGSVPDDIWGYTLPWFQEDPDWWKRD